ncbi:MAG: elongation factor G [Dehalococcoidia bacterium]
MADLKTEAIRNVVLLSHNGAGKTSLSEAMLFNAGVVTRLGTVEDGNTTSDYEPEEIKRQSSIQCAILPWRQHDIKVNTIDTPGYADFIGEVLTALRVADGAVITVCAASGVEVGTELMWRLVQERSMPALIVVNKMDRENADFLSCMEEIQTKLDKKCVPIQLPIGSQSDFQGIINLIARKAEKAAQESEMPPSLKEQAEEAREKLVERIAETDDDLTTKYLEGEEITEEELAMGLKKATISGAIAPVITTSAAQNLGVKQLMEAICQYLPSPKDVPQEKAINSLTQEKELITLDGDAPLATLVFKTTADPYVGKLSYFRVYSNTLYSDSHIWNVNKNQAERLGQLFIPRGKSQEPTPQVIAGDIGAVAKLAETGTGDTLSHKDHPLMLDPIEFPYPPYTVAVYPKTKADVDKMGAALARLCEEDPCMQVRREQDTNETIMAAMGDSHVEVTIEKLRRKFSVDVRVDVPKVPYKETISVSAKAEYKHKKQTGGHGQYGHVFLELTPLPRGAGFEFIKKVVGGAIPKNYIPAVEKGVLDALKEGVVVGYSVVDMRVTLYDGSYHTVDSSDNSFRIAGAHALRKGVGQAQPILLEPIMLIRVTVPESYTGDIIGDMNSKRAKVLGMVPQNGFTTVEAEAPLAEILRYATDLRSLTQGRGTYTMEFVHYAEVPTHIAQRVIGEAQKAQEKD